MLFVHWNMSVHVIGAHVLTHDTFTCFDVDQHQGICWQLES